LDRPEKSDTLQAAYDFATWWRQPMQWTLYRKALSIICLFPYSISLQFYRVFNRALKVIKAEYTTVTYFGARMSCKTSDIIQSRILHFGVWEPEVSRVIQELLSPGDVFVDIGANVGYDTLLGSWRVGPTGAVVAIEAMPTTFALLQRNLALNVGARNVRAVQLAASDKPGTLDLYHVEDNNIGAASTLAHRGTRLVGTATAAPFISILRDDELSRVRLVKIDIEGSEPAVLRNMLDNIERFPETTDILVEVSPQDVDAGWREIFDRLRAVGYRSYEILNLYDLKWYLSRPKHTALRLAETLPREQQDLLFTRHALPAALA
jgi:FkbM family methyltransferase